jgi:predicted acylesterase/phospholipase RssA
MSLFNLNLLFHQPEFIKNNQINAICLSAGAAKGFYQLGACHFLNSISKLETINTFIGTSVGSALACLLCIGYDPLEFLSYLCTNDVNNCWDYEFSLQNLIIEWGVIDHIKLKNYLEKAILSKLGYIPTFEDIYINLGKIFICSAWCINSDNHKVYFNYINTPSVLVTDAVIASCAIPGLFTKVEINKKIYLDGALFDFCPLEYLISFLSTNFSSVIGDIITIYAKSVPSSTINTVKNKENKIQTFLDYIKEISYIPFYIQKECNIEEIKKKYGDLNSNSIFIKNIQYYVLNCDHNEITLNLDIKSRIKNFCDGYDQMKQLINNKIEIEN